VAESWGLFRNPEEKVQLLLDAVTRGLVKTQLTQKKGRVVVNCGVCEIVLGLESVVVMSYKKSLNPVANPNPISSHSDR
jgi:hypothetical protein